MTKNVSVSRSPFRDTSMSIFHFGNAVNQNLECLYVKLQLICVFTENYPVTHLLVLKVLDYGWWNVQEIENVITQHHLFQEVTDFGKYASRFYNCLLKYLAEFSQDVFLVVFLAVPFDDLEDVIQAVSEVLQADVRVKKELRCLLKYVKRNNFCKLIYGCCGRRSNLSDLHWS